MLEDAMVQDAFSGHGFGEGHSLCMRCQKKLYSQRSREIGLGPHCERILALQAKLREEAVWDTTSNLWQVSDTQMATAPSTFHPETSTAGRSSCSVHT